MILIVTHRRGFEADRVIDRLNSLGESVFRLNTDIETRDLAIDISINDGTKRCNFFAGEREINIEDVDVAWFQQPWSWKEPIEPFELARQQSYQALLEAALDEIEAPWLNSPSSIRVASNKPRQLLNALKAGLQIPTTLISNYPNSVAKMTNLIPEIVAKSISPQWLHISGKDNAAYTQKLDLRWVSNKKAISYAPVEYQEFHRRQSDIRVVVVGDNFFCVRCEAKENHPAYDVRKKTNLRYVPHTLPASILSGLRELMKLLSVEYCSADFIESIEGELFFIDLNVTGSWWWIDDVYFGAVTESITSYLLTHKLKRCL